jgi:hypothetical protein
VAVLLLVAMVSWAPGVLVTGARPIEVSTRGSTLLVHRARCSDRLARLVLVLLAPVWALLVVSVSVGLVVVPSGWALVVAALLLMVAVLRTMPWGPMSISLRSECVWQAVFKTHAGTQLSVRAERT